MENKCGSKEGHKGACRKQGWWVGWAWVVVEEGGGGGRAAVLARTCGLATQREKGSGAAFLDPINLWHLHHHEMAPHTARNPTPLFNPPKGEKIGKKKL
jgi:hypothetical protein